MPELAAILEQAHDWKTAVPHLAALPDAACRELAPALERWPDADRLAPAGWIDQALAGDPPPALQLCRSLSLADRRRDADAIDRLLRHPHLAGITQLTLGMDARELTPQWFASLTALQELRIETTEPFTSALRDDQLATLAASPLQHLTLLSLDNVHLRGPGVAALARSSTLTALTTLELYAPATAALCKALATRPAPALRGVRHLALCADHFTVAAAAALARAEDLLADLDTLEFRIAESNGFDWAEPFSHGDGERNARRFAAALARLLPALHDCSRVTIAYPPGRAVVHLDRADIEGLARKPRELRESFPRALAG